MQINGRYRLVTKEVESELSGESMLVRTIAASTQLTSRAERRSRSPLLRR